jgi:hypothetical protein
MLNKFIVSERIYRFIQTRHNKKLKEALGKGKRYNYDIRLCPVCKKRVEIGQIVCKERRKYIHEECYSKFVIDIPDEGTDDKELEDFFVIR